MSKHTPGPWEYRPAMNYVGFSIAPLGVLPTLAACERFGNNMSVTCFNFPGSTEANARLIAAAPELLEALEELVEQCEIAQGLSDYNYGKFDLVHALKAISKARGE